MKNGQTEGSERLLIGVHSSKMVGLEGCFQYAVVSAYQQGSKKGQLVTLRQGYGWPKLINVCGERRLVCLL